MAKSTIHSRIKQKALVAGGFLVTILAVGTAGYRFISGGRSSLIDCVYMTVITIATIGYGEIVDLSHSPGGRVFTMFMSVTGIGVMTYIMVSLTDFVVEGELNEAFRRKKMEKRIAKLSGHYIVCGVHGIGAHIVRELSMTRRPHVVVDREREEIDRLPGGVDETVFVTGDATDNETLLEAGIARAAGLFAVTGDDNQNMVISLSAKQLNPKIRVVARCEAPRNMEKMQRAGADDVVSPTSIGGMRMASVMLRPAVVTFLDVMLRREDEHLRIEEVAVPAAFVGRPLSAIDFPSYPRLLLLALRRGDGWSYNPPRDTLLQAGDTLVFMGTPEERVELERDLGEPSPRV
jgi:voltage-gated potassium channel